MGVTNIDLGNIMGPQGPVGPAGAKGLTGATGVPGATGPAGAKGADGGAWLSGAIAPTTQGKTGDYYINTSNFDVYSKSSGSWVKTGNIKGATGSIGPAGPKGDTGAQGSVGAQGPKGDVGAAGIAGVKGATGDRGAAGPTGPQGVKGDKGDTGPAGTNTNMAGATNSVAGKAGLAPAPAAGAATRYLRSDGTWSVPPDTNTVYTHPTGAGNNHIPAGGATGQFLKWSAAGTAVWAADNNTTYGIATAAANGLMSKEDKTKLNSCLVGDGMTKLQHITQAAYDDLSSKDASTLYIITE